MSQLVHISSITPPGLLPDKKYPGASNVDHVQFSRHAGMLLRNLGCDMRTSVVCAAGPNNQQRKSSDYSRQNRGYSSGRNRKPDTEKESYDTTDFASKNGPMSQPSNNPRYQATTAPGQREKEIVELFRKVQAQLRQRVAVNREERIPEPPQQAQGEKGSVDSLLKLLRKHSTNQEKKRGNEEYNVEQTERDNPFEEEANSNFFELNNFPSEVEVEENVTRAPSRRPASNFQRRSPVTRANRSIRSADETAVTAPYLKATGKQGEKKHGRGNSVTEMETREPIFFDDNEEEFEEESESSEIDDDEDEESVLPGIGIDELGGALEDATEPSTMTNSDLDSMKVPELRQLAKSRGKKGYSSMKKADLVRLLSEDET